jgi:RNA polymerase sigma-70 factor (ECF subfamily)
MSMATTRAARRLSDALAGDRGALEDCLLGLADPLFGYIASMVPNRADAEDLLQETLLKAVRAWPGFRPRGAAAPAFRGWLYRIAVNCVRDHLRAARPAGPLPEDLSADDLARGALSDLKESPEEAVDRSLRAGAVRRAIGALPPDLREVVTLRIYAGLSFAEIAELQACPLNTALGRMRYALLNLRAALEPVWEA